MKTILIIIYKELIQLKNDKKMFGILFVAPLFQLILLGYAATLDVRNVDIVVVDRDKSRESRELFESIQSTGHFSVKAYLESEQGIDDSIEHWRAGMGVVIPPDFSRQLKRGKNTAIQLIVDGTDANTAGISAGYMIQIIGKYTKDILARRFAQSGFRVPQIQVESRVFFNPELNSRFYFLTGILALLLMIITMMLSAMAIVKEKEIGTLEQLNVTPIRSYQLIIGKLAPFTLIGFIDVFLILGVVFFWFEVPFRGSLGFLLVASGLYLMSTLGLGLFISTIAANQQQAMMLTVFFIMMPFLFLAGFVFPIENMPEIIQKITYAIPLRYYLTMIRGIFLKGVFIRELWFEVVMLASMGALILSLSILRFKKRA